MIIVQKFGGSSVADVEKIQNVAKIVQKEKNNSNSVVVVVSAMFGETDRLLGLCGEIRKSVDSHAMAEYDSVVASGEQVSAGLLALALQDIGIKAVSMCGWQAGLKTDEFHMKARINSIESSEKMLDLLNNDYVVVVAGFQGIAETNRITTLGRGGSDASAVALAISLNANRCDIYKDVDGVYTTDPRVCSAAKKIDNLSLEEMLELSSTGSKVLQVRAVEMAMRYGMTICVRSTFDLEKPGTMITKNTNPENLSLIAGISHTVNESVITVKKIENIAEFYVTAFGKFLSSNIGTDMIIQNEYLENDKSITDMTFVVNKSEFDRMKVALDEVKTNCAFSDISVQDDVAKISIVGVNMKNSPGITSKMFIALAKVSINVICISTSDIKISIIVERKYMELAVRTLHEVFFE